jgi:predicted GIY-YIG superfamily endonuclease
MYIYCLQLEGGRFYIGQTPCTRLRMRYEEHLYRHGSLWTSRFKPLKLMWFKKTTLDEADRIEDEECLKIMLEHGPNSCRGGKFNTRYDVSLKGPKWLKSPYLERWPEIINAIT